MFTVFMKMLIRLMVGLAALVIYMNLLGRMQLSPQSAVDQIGNYILGGILGGIIYNLDLEFYKFFMAIAIWTILMLVLNYITQKSLQAKRAIKGNPILLMEDGKFEVAEFENNKINIDDILSKLHQKGVYSVNNIKTLWLEPNGELTIISYDDKNIGWVLIEGGQVNQIDLARLEQDEGWIMDNIDGRKIEDVFYLEYLDGQFLIYDY